jgi:hypothetical protein
MASPAHTHCVVGTPRTPQPASRYFQHLCTLANRAFTGPAQLLQVIRHGLRKIQYQPGIIEGCLAGIGLSLEPDGTTSAVCLLLPVGAPARGI